MSERERWIVYPLLFLALGAALRDKLLKLTVADQVVCKQLIVRDDTGNTWAVVNDKGVQAGHVQATVLDAQQITQSGQPITSGGSQTQNFSAMQLWRILQYLQQAGALQLTPPVSVQSSGEASAAEADSTEAAEPAGKSPATESGREDSADTD